MLVVSPHGTQYERELDLPAMAARAGRLATVPAVGLALNVVTTAVIFVRALASHEVLAPLVCAAAGVLLAHAELANAVGIAGATTMNARAAAGLTSSKEHVY